MKRLLLSALLASVTLLVGCQAVETTSSGAVGVERKQYMFKALSAEEIDKASSDAYGQLIAEAKADGKLHTNTKDGKRLQQIAQRMKKHVAYFRPDAANWAWEVHLIDSPEKNAACMPGGKIFFYSGIIQELKLTDDEIAAIMGHEMAHALREHSREQISKAYGVEMAKGGIGALLGLDQGTMGLLGAAVDVGMMLPNSRSAEAEADLIGIELAARSGYDPNGAVTLWQKMQATSQREPASFLSTHPSTGSRIQNLQQAIPRVMPLYEQARLN